MKKVRVSHVKPYHVLPKVKPQKPVVTGTKKTINKKYKSTKKTTTLEATSTSTASSRSIVKTHQQFKIESAYATPAQKYWRPFESRQASTFEKHEIAIEQVKLKNGWYS